MAKRILFGAAMIAILWGLLHMGWWLEFNYSWTALNGLPTAAVLLLVVLGGFRELARLAKAAGAELLEVSGLSASVLLATLPYWYRQLSRAFHLYWVPGPSDAIVMLLGLSLLAIFAEQMFRRTTNDAIRRVSATLLTATILGLCGAIVFRIRLRGIEELVVFLVAVKCTDIGAYFTGSFIGRHKMIPWLSPGKSWEGLVGGLATAAGAAILVSKAIPLEPNFVAWKIATFAVCIGLAGQFGDLCESLLKRAANQKDSGSVVPEFGGVLDIIDSPLLASPVALLLLGLLS